MSDAVNTLLLLSELVCEISIKKSPQITKREFEQQITKINDYEKELQIAIFMQAVQLYPNQSVEDCIISYSRVLSHLENCLIEGLPKIEKDDGEDSLTVSLTRHILLVVRRLREFIDNRFLHLTPGKQVTDKAQLVEKLKLNLPVSVIATLVSAFVRSADNIILKEETAVMRFVIQLFSSKQASEIAFKSFQNNYRTPERAAIEKSINILQAMIKWLRNN